MAAIVKFKDTVLKPAVSNLITAWGYFFPIYIKIEEINFFWKTKYYNRLFTIDNQMHTIFFSLIYYVWLESKRFYMPN